VPTGCTKHQVLCLHIISEMCAPSLCCPCSYPFCWRSDTPLIQLACPAWFVSVEPLKDKLLVNNKVR
jgi:hypothetical protein